LRTLFIACLWWMPFAAFGSTVYTFSENVANRGTVGFTYTAPSYLTTATNYVSDFYLSSCDTSGMPGWRCTGAYLTQRTIGGAPSVSVTLALVYTADPADAFSTDSVFDSFPGASLTVDGTYTGFLNGATFAVYDPPEGAATAPEPKTWGLLALAGMLLWTRLRGNTSHRQFTE
jgi:hypothetical protein